MVALSKNQRSYNNDFDHNVTWLRLFIRKIDWIALILQHMSFVAWRISRKSIVLVVALTLYMSWFAYFDFLEDIFRSVSSLTPPIPEIIWVKNVRAIVVCGFPMKLLKKYILKIWKKTWEPFGSYLLNSTANPAQFEWKWAGLAVLFSR